MPHATRVIVSRQLCQPCAFDKTVVHFPLCTAAAGGI